MSCFVMSPESLANLSVFLTRKMLSNYYCGIKIKAKEMLKTELCLENVVNEKMFARTLFEAMWKMNCKAYATRYKEECQNSLPHFPATKDISSFQALKSLNCLLYQCNEENIPDTTPLFDILVNIANGLTGWIVGNLPEYMEAEWG